MFIALNKDKKRVHISDVLDNETYYCPMCYEELRCRKGDANAHHFAHKNNSECKANDGWNYDMSDWHFDWQNQFPLDNQEVVFSYNNKVHRADVFINNTVIEFQRSPITESEFNDRNEFYKGIGYNVVWVFDAINKEIEYLNDTKDDERLFSWKHPIRFLKNFDCSDHKVNVFLQIKEGIWYRQPNYKNIKDFQQLDIDNNIVKISNNKIINNIGTFISDDYYSDVEIIDTYYDLKLQNKKKYLYKNNINIHKLSDEIYNYNVDSFYDFYGYCPLTKSELFNHKECYECNYLDVDHERCRCMFRFKEIRKNNISEIYDIKYDRDGRIVFFDLEINNERKKYTFESLPSYSKSLLDFSEKYNKFRVARFVNIENGQKIQLSQYDMKQLINTKKCYGKFCDVKYQNVKNFISNWDKSIWLLVWYKNNDSYYCENNSYLKSSSVVSSNYNSNCQVPTNCPKCGGMITLLDDDFNVGCCNYPKCNFII